MVNLDPVNTQQYLPITLLSNAISASEPGVTQCFDFVNKQSGDLDRLLHNPPCFDDILNVADADKLWESEKHKQTLANLYVIDGEPITQMASPTLGELTRTLLSGFVAEPLPIARKPWLTPRGYHWQGWLMANCKRSTVSITALKWRSPPL